MNMNEFNNDIIKVIYMIKRKPLGYLGELSISKLRCFMDGFSFGYDYPKFHPFINEFQEYIENKYKCYSNSWNNILLSYAKDEEVALELFFNEFSNFLKKNSIEEPHIE